MFKNPEKFELKSGEGPEVEKKEKRGLKEIYLKERLEAVKDRFSEYFPDIYRGISTKLNYQDRAQELKVNHFFDKDKNLIINIRTPENLSDKDAEDLKKMETDFLVFRNVARGEKIAKKVQDFFFLTHEYAHGINARLIQEFCPDLMKTMEKKRKEAEIIDLQKKKILERQVENSILPALGEGFPISFEKLMAEKLLKDPRVSEEDKKAIALFWKKHQETLSNKKIEKDPKSKYTELDEVMVYYKIYQEQGEGGILAFIENLDFERLFKIKKYIDSSKKILSEEYKNFLDKPFEI